jgi:hypothetical protein
MEDIESKREQIRRVLLDAIPRVGSTKPPVRARWPRGFSMGFPPPGGTYVFEQGACDEERGNCIGEVLTAWLIDREGIAVVDVKPSEIGHESYGMLGMWYRFGRVHFYISPDAEWVVRGVVSGKRAGFGGRYRVVRGEDSIEFVAEGPHWKS